MKKTVLKFVRLFVGFIVCALSIVFMINANLGLSPWDVLHEGISNKLGITMGMATIVVGIIVVIMDVVLGENVGWGTVLNMLLVGVFLDIIMFTNMIPVAENIVTGIIMLCIGMTLMGFGMVLYLGCGLGSGPRDGMMVAFQKKTNKSIKSIRATMEICALGAGYLLGGTAGIGTVVTAIGLGYFIQIVFKVCKFKSEDVVHRFIIDDVNYVKAYISKDIDKQIEKNSL
ncbi:MAG: YczE/YyaS/YitT family protein [Romboutsia sp.]|uniref:YczE/YyaS/YitT family protein n=1 Tax=Romboutsia sp. TaxID=1965302 RepID=UPI003F386F36